MTPPDRPVQSTSTTARRLFLERSGYVQRRLIDAARLLPLLGLFLWLVPLAWPRGGEGNDIGSAGASIYIFGVWGFLICLGAIIAARIGPAAEAHMSDQEPGMDGPMPEPMRSDAADPPWDS